MKDIKCSAHYLPDGMKFTPTYEHCPKCGYDLNQMPDTLVDKVDANKAENSSSDTEASLKTSTKESLAPHFFNKCVAWMVLPFATAKKYATKRNK